MESGSELPYDEQTSEQQVRTRARWARGIARSRAALNYEAEFVAKGWPYSEAGQDGELLLRFPLDPGEG
jgi:hypothetical protein